MDVTWYKVAQSSESVPEGGRIHARVEERFITLFRHNGKLTAIDSICHHAGGPLTLGELQDIEDLNMRVVLCPWHKFMVSIETGEKAYQSVEFKAGKPIVAGWKVGKVVQRPHRVLETASGVFVSLVITTEPCSSDNDAKSTHCAQEYEIHTDTATPANPAEIQQAISSAPPGSHKG